MRPLAILLCAAVVVGACASPRTVAVPPPASSPASTPAVSPTVSIYPVPSIRPPRRTAAPPAPTSVPSPVDAGGVACGAQTDQTVHHVRVIGRTTCYPVVGSTPAVLQAQVLRLGPKAGGKRAVAVTRWRITWSYSLASGTDGCAVVKPDVRLATVYVFPTWNPDAGTPSATTTYWASYMADVRAHEGHHRQIAVAGAVAVRRALLATPTDPSCQRVSDVADGRAKDVIAAYQQKQHAFDAAAGG